MFENIMNYIDIGAIIVTVLTGILAFIGTKLKALYEEKIKNEKIREVVQDVVNWIEMKSKNEAIQNKYEVAKEKIINILASNGINITDDEIDLLIESFVNKLQIK